MSFFRIVSSSLSPNLESDDFWAAVKTLCSLRLWIIGNARSTSEKWLEKYFDNRNVLTFNSGRSALFTILKAFGIGKGDEVIVQAFTCVAVPNSVIWTGARPVYVDVDTSLNIDPKDVEKKITKKTKAIIVQHTFGTPAQMEKILSIAKNKNLFIIEDCAHSLGAQYNDKKLGTFGDAAAFSFGRDKVISSIFGGAAMMSSRNADAWTKLKQLHSDMSYPSGFWVMQQLLHPIAFWFILPLYRIGIGKILLWILQRLRILGFPVYPEEKKGKKPTFFPRKYPNGLAILLLVQLKKLDRFNKQRLSVARLYEEKLSKNVEILHTKNSLNLRFPVLVSNPKQVLQKAKRHGVLLGHWYHNVIDPVGTEFSAVGYVKGTCPQAEYYAEHIINLPTNISEKDAKRVMKELL